MRLNPASYQCPYWYCLARYVPNKPHKHRKLDRADSDRILARVPDWTTPEGRKRALQLDENPQPPKRDDCSCGSTVSGRELWGDTWGGECDRAEARASALMDRLSKPSGDRVAVAA